MLSHAVMHNAYSSNPRRACLCKQTYAWAIIIAGYAINHNDRLARSLMSAKE